MRKGSPRSRDNLGAWISRVWIVSALVLLFAPPSGASEVSERIDALLARYQELGLFNGSVLVAERGEIVLQKGYGLANMEWGQPNTSDTKFRLGSITKVFTAALVLQLVEQGRLALEAPVRRYLPEYPAPAGERVTIHHLLTHTSGIVGYTDTPTFAVTSRKPSTPVELMNEQFAKLELLFAPGTHFSYSNSGYFLLGVILERLTGKSYETLLRERLFAPLGMNDSGYDSNQALSLRRAAGYDRRFDGSHANAAYIDMSQPYAAGAVYSTVEDLYRWDQGLYAEKVLGGALQQRMFTPGLGDFGYGWDIKRQEGRLTVEHAGAINGFSALFTREPETRRLIVLLGNVSGLPLKQVAAGVRALLDGRAPATPRRPGAPALFETYQSAGLAPALERAREMQAGGEYDAGSDELARLAGHLLATGRHADALELAKQVARDAPRSAAAAVLLARAHQANGQRVEALQSYARAIEVSDTPRMFPMYMSAMRELAALEAPERK